MRILVLYAHRVALDRTPGCDVTAHDASADDMDMLDIEIQLFALALESFLQEEDADSVRDLATQAMDLTHEIVGKLDNATTVA